MRTSVEPDQRVPVQPVAGEPLELRGNDRRRRRGALGRARPRRHDRAHRGGARRGCAVVVSAAADDGASERCRRRLGQGAQAGVEGHARHARRRGAPALPLRRRRRAAHTAWHSTVVAEWRRDGGTLDVHVRDRPPVAEQRVLAHAGSKVQRVRFALRLEPGERVVGFGERFDALDQRGRARRRRRLRPVQGPGRTHLPADAVRDRRRRRAGASTSTTSAASGSTSAAATRPHPRSRSTSSRRRQPRRRSQLFAGTPAEVLDAFLTETGRRRAAARLDLPARG